MRGGTHLYRRYKEAPCISSAFRSPTNVIPIGIHTHTLLQPLPFARPRRSANDILRIENILRTERFSTCTVQEHNSKFCNTEFVPAADGHIIACLQVLYYRASTLLQSKYFTTGHI